jgi:transketolase
MNEFGAWAKIIEEWKQANRMKELNQDLYDILASSLLYVWDYAEKNDIVLPHRERLNRILENIHDKTEQIWTLHRRINSSDDFLQRDKKDRNPTETGQNP